MICWSCFICALSMWGVVLIGAVSCIGTLYCVVDRHVEHVAVNLGVGAGITVRLFKCSRHPQKQHSELMDLGLSMFASWVVLPLLCKSSVICLSASVLVSVSGASGEPAVGFWRACRMSHVALVIMLVDDAVGMGVVIGNHVSV